MTTRHLILSPVKDRRFGLKIRGFGLEEYLSFRGATMGLSRASGAIREDAVPQQRAVSLLRDVLEKSAHVLLVAPEQLATQLLGRLRHLRRSIPRA
jgi:hypothetical protein